MCGETSPEQTHGGVPGAPSAREQFSQRGEPSREPPTAWRRYRSRNSGRLAGSPPMNLYRPGSSSSGACTLRGSRPVPHVHRGRAVITIQQLEADRRAPGVVVEANPVTQQQRRDVEVDLVDEAQREQLPADGGGEDFEVLATRGIEGRDRARLEAVAARHPGMSVLVMDVADPESVTRGMAEVATETSHLTTLVNNAGIQRLLDFSAAQPPGPTDIAPEIATNLAGLINVTAAGLPLLRRAPRSRVVHLGSGLGFVPYAKTPVYSATKAAVHSFTLSLRRQLAGSTVQVVEIIPPVVDTPLHRHLPTPPPMAMPLERFLDRVMQGLDAGKDEIPIGLGRVSQIGARVAPKRLFTIINRDD